MRWKTPVLDKISLACGDSGIYRVQSGRFVGGIFLSTEEKEWLMEHGINHGYTKMFECYLDHHIDHLLMPKKLAVEFVLRFGGKP